MAQLGVDIDRSPVHGRSSFPHIVLLFVRFTNNLQIYLMLNDNNNIFLFKRLLRQLQS